ncbi:recombinase family protein, partial [Xanthomonas hortorum]|uniref:recombinase family protein n=1 Tax=Xanthomonas hortorum TaxID=56454 RepID=UPI003982D6E9
PFRSSRLIGAERQPTSDCRQSLQQSPLDYMREGDTLVVWKLDRLARSLTQLIETVESVDRRAKRARIAG